MPSRALCFTACPPLRSFISPRHHVSFCPSAANARVEYRKYTAYHPCHFRQTVTTGSITSNAPSQDNITSTTATEANPVAAAVSKSVCHPGSTPVYDVVVIGAGPAGLSLAAALSQQQLSVCCIDESLRRPWPNHYGVWRDEFESVGYEDCDTATYDTTVVHAGSEPRDEIKLDRGYIRVDRVKLKARLIDECQQYGVTFIERHVHRVEHNNAQWSTAILEPCRYSEATKGDQEAEAETDELRTHLIVDCTGHAVAFTRTHDDTSARKQHKWYQAAYGIEAEVDVYPYAKDEMVLMDFRDEHMTTRAEREASERQPTFLYVFPMSERRAFFEETSVIQTQAVSFDELKSRLYKRLQHMGIEVKRVIDEEQSLIPMGGKLPDRSQRVVAFGGAALLVHPATGYMVGRTVRLAHRIAKRVKHGLDRVGANGDVMQVAASCWDELWGVKVRRQRDFLMFGAELLESLGMAESRAFFHAFFKVPRDLWCRFLSYDLDHPVVRVQFALMFFLVANNHIRFRLLSALVTLGGWRMVRSITPEWMTAFQD